MPRTEIEVDTVLFDMDGTLIDSTPAVNRTWQEYAERYHLDMEELLRHAHGHRTVENLARYIPGLQGSALLQEVQRFEARILEYAEQKVHESATQGRPQGNIVAMPGAKELLRQIHAGAERNPSRRAGWAIVTSGMHHVPTHTATDEYAKRAYPLAGVSDLPSVFVTGDMISKGKPDPEPYQRGADLAKVSDISRCLVVEDAPPGVRSGKATGARVLGLKTTHDGARMWESGADWVVDDLSKVQARWDGDKLLLSIDSDAKP